MDNNNSKYGNPVMTNSTLYETNFLINTGSHIQKKTLIFLFLKVPFEIIKLASLILTNPDIYI